MRFIWVRASVQLSSPVDASSDSLHIDLALVRMVLFRVGWKGVVSSHNFYTRLLEWLAYYHWVFFSLTRCIVQDLVYLLSLNFQPCPIWKASRGIRSWGSF